MNDNTLYTIIIINIIIMELSIDADAKMGKHSLFLLQSLIQSLTSVTGSVFCDHFTGIIFKF